MHMAILQLSDCRDPLPAEVFGILPQSVFHFPVGCGEMRHQPTALRAQHEAEPAQTLD